MKIRNMFLLVCILVLPINLFGMSLINKCKSKIKSLYENRENRAIEQLLDDSQPPFSSRITIEQQFIDLINTRINSNNINSIRFGHMYVDGVTLLIYAVRKGYVEATKLLIAKGINLNAQDDSRRTALFYAAGSRNESIVELLIKSGANLDILDGCGRTALLYTTRMALPFSNPSYFRVIELLVKAGANLHIQGNCGETLLDDGDYPHPMPMNIITLLITRGAVVDNTDNLYGTPFLERIKNDPNRKEIMELLEHRKKEVKDKLLQHIPVKPLCDIINDYLY